jgi:hypothetical protein
MIIRIKDLKLNKVSLLNAMIILKIKLLIIEENVFKKKLPLFRIMFNKVKNISHPFQFQHEILMQTHDIHYFFFANTF